MITRPLSPHLQIYKLPLAALISISHRFAAVVIFAAMALAALYAVLFVFGINLSGVNLIAFSKIGKVFISLLSLCVSFYCAAEARYVVWGFNKGLSPRFVEISNHTILIATLVLFLLCVKNIWG